MTDQDRKFPITLRFERTLTTVWAPRDLDVLVAEEEEARVTEVFVDRFLAIRILEFDGGPSRVEPVSVSGHAIVTFLQDDVRRFETWAAACDRVRDAVQVWAKTQLGSEAGGAGSPAKNSHLAGALFQFR